MEIELNNTDVCVAIEEFILKRFHNHEVGSDGHWRVTQQAGTKVEAIRYVVSLEEKG